MWADIRRREWIVNMLRLLNERLEEALITLLLSLMSVVIIFQVFMRYALGASLSWSEELARYAFIWMVYVGISFAVRRNRHLSVDAVNMLFGKTGRFVISIISDLLFLAFAIVISVNGWSVVQRVAASGQSSASIEVPMWFVYAAMPTGFSLICFRLVQSLCAKIRSGRDPGSTTSFVCPVDPEASLPASSRSDHTDKGDRS